MSEAWSAQQLFGWFVNQQQAVAWMYLGKVPNPMTGEVDRDLGAAKLIIDLLGMIEEKTKGNLTGDEEKLLGQVLSTLRLNYVQESQKPEPPTPAEPEEGAASEGPDGPEGRSPDPGEETDDAPKVEGA